MVEYNNKQASGGVGRGPADEGVGEGKHQQQQQGEAEGEEQEVAEAAMAGRALGAALEKHQRTHGAGCGDVPPQQVHKDGDAEREQTAEKPGCKEAHQLPACLSVRYSRRASSRG